MSPADIPPSLSDDQMRRLSEVVQQKTGLVIATTKSREILARLGDHIHKAGSAETFLRELKLSPKLHEDIVNKLTIGESYFFRNHPHFNALQNEIIPEIIRRQQHRKKIKIWSAGSSTGEEPYSVAIMLQRDFPTLHDWNIEILATDINTRFIDKAKKARYTQWSFRGVDKLVINRYFKRIDSSLYELKKELREKVSFSKLNLASIPKSIEKRFQDCDLILCRNVLIYFDTKLSTAICDTFADCLTEKGFLILGHSESFPALKDMKTVYSHATYYYKKETPPVSKEIPPAQHRMSLVPGLGPYDPQKMITPWQNDITSTPFASESVAKVVPGTQVAATRSFASLDIELKGAIEDDLKHVRDYSMEGELDKAAALLHKLEATDGNLDYRVYFLKALIADQRNETEESLQHLKQAIFLNKDFVIGHYYQGIIAERAGYYIVAKRGYRNTCALAKELRPDVEVKEGGGITAKILLEIAMERLKELEM